MTQPNATNPEITTETLKALTGAPDLDAPLVDTEDFDPQPEPSARPLWKMPLPKLALIGTALVPVFLLASYFVLGGQKTRQVQQPSISPETGPKQVSGNGSGEVDHLKQENADLKVDSALDGQSHLLVQENAEKSDEDLTIEEETEAAESETVAPSPRPTTISHRPEPQPVRAAPAPRPATRTTPQPIRPSQVAQVPRIDPVEQWQQLVQLGSYGNIAPPETLPQETGNTANSELSPTVESEAPILLASAAPISTMQIPTAQIAPTSGLKSSRPVQQNDSKPSLEPDVPQVIDDLDAPQPTVISSLSELNDIEAEGIGTGEAAPTVEAIAPPILLDDVENAEVIVQANIPSDILHEAEAAILTGQPQMQSLVAGNHGAGELITPIILEPGFEGSRFLVTLHEPLFNNQGTVAIPANSQIMVEVEHSAENGMVQLSAVGVTWAEGSGQRELILPSGVIHVRGQNGEPLMAERFDDPGDEIAAMDVGQFALGAVRRTAELYTRSDSRVETRNNTTIVTEDNPDPNILAGVLEGGTDAILDSITERNHRAIATLESRPPIWVLDAGTPVQIFVNQSMQLPQ